MQLSSIVHLSNEEHIYTERKERCPIGGEDDCTLCFPHSAYYCTSFTSLSLPTLLKIEWLYYQAGIQRSAPDGEA
jgi:hypothetical protein